MCIPILVTTHISKSNPIPVKIITIPKRTSKISIMPNFLTFVKYIIMGMPPIIGMIIGNNINPIGISPTVQAIAITITI